QEFVAGPEPSSPRPFGKSTTDSMTAAPTVLRKRSRRITAGSGWYPVTGRCPRHRNWWTPIPHSEGGSIMNPRRVALVTGSGKRRVGWYVADALARRGYALAVHYRNSAAEAEGSVADFRTRGVEAVALQADLTDERSVHELIGQTLERFGRLDVLV